MLLKLKLLFARRKYMFHRARKRECRRKPDCRLGITTLGSEGTVLGPGSHFYLHFKYTAVEGLNLVSVLGIPRAT